MLEEPKKMDIIESAAKILRKIIPLEADGSIQFHFGKNKKNAKVIITNTLQVKTAE